MHSRFTRRAILLVALSTALTGAVAVNALADDMHDGAGDSTETSPMPASQEAPAKMTNGMTVTKDAKMGYNLHVRTTRFRWTPWNASKAHVQGQGHAHLYVDGEKVTRLYGPWYFLGDLSKGRHTVKVTLNGNDHGDYVHGTKTVAASRVVKVS
mgnify:CR=1 FL=1